MKQVQIIINDFFDGFLYDIKNEKGHGLCHIIRDIILDKANQGNKLSEYLKYFVWEYSKNESRETIIQAIFEYQKSLLPKTYYKHLFFEKSIEPTYCDINSIPDLYNNNQLKNFYDPVTRIITITDFEVNNEDNK